MKANQFIKLKHDDSGYVKVVGGIIALLITILVGIMIYFNVVDSADAYDDSITETFTGYAWATANASAWSVDLDYSPVNAANTNVTCYNGTAGTESYPTFGLSNKRINVAADAADYFSQVNVTYVSHIANTESGATSTASSVFGLLPIIALVVVAVIIVGVVIGFGRGRGGGL